MTAALAAAASLLLLPVLVISAAMGGVEVAQPSPTALADIPADYLALYQEAATELGMPWELLAAVGKVESDHGRNPASRKPNAAGAEGPMQFLPATFAEYSWASGSPDPNIDNPRDAIYAAAAMLVDNNVRDNPRQALYAYNHSNAYVDQVLAWAAVYQSQSDTAAGEAAARPRRTDGGGRAARSATRSRSSAPPTSGAATAPAASTAPASSRPPTPPPASSCRAPPRSNTTPGRPSRRRAARARRPRLLRHRPDHVSHVGILINPTEMVDAPHTGAAVRVEPYHWPDYLGATRPSGRQALRRRPCRRDRTACRHR